MIDIGLAKIAMIGVVALVVIGPERLPKVARMAGTLLGRAQRYMNQVKSEVSREMELDELRKMQQQMQDVARDVEQSVAHNIKETERSIHSTWNDEPADIDYPAQPSGEQLAVKAKNFRKKKLARTSAIPSWYKRQNGHKMRVQSAAARVAKYRPASKTGKPSAFFH